MTSPNVPTLKVEIAFATTNAFDTSPTWTDVSSYVLTNPGVQITRGRANELSTFSSGRATLTLRNDDGRFSPLNASSPYVGQLLPRKQIRISATWAATDYVLFRGFVTGWPQAYSQAKKMAYVALECYDLLAILNETDIQDQYYEYQRTGIGSMRLAYMDVAGRALIDRVSSQDLRYRASTVATASDLAPGLTGSTAVTFGGGVSASGPQDEAAVTLGSTIWSLSFWFSSTSGGTLVSGSFGSEYITVELVGGFGSITCDGIALTAVSGRSDLADGTPHHVVVVSDGSNAFLYIDGVDDTSGFASSGAYPTVDNIGGVVATNNFLNGTVQATTVFSKALSATEVKNLYRMGLGVFYEDAGTRFGRVCDAAGVPSSWRLAVTPTYGRCSTQFTGGSALAELQAVAATEQGAMFVTKEGVLVLLSRYWQIVSGGGGTTIQATFSDDGADSPYVDVGFDYDDLQVRNAITITGIDCAATATDSTSIAKYGRQEMSVTTQLGTYAECLTMAQGMLADLKDPKVRSRPLVVYPQTKTSTWPTVLSQELGNRVRFEVTPPGVAAQYQSSQLIQQLDWNIQANAWELTIQGTPLPTAAAIYDTDTYTGSAVYGY